MEISDVKIATRLTLAFGVLALLIVVMGGASMLKAGAMEESHHKVVSQSYPTIVAVNKIKDEINIIERSSREALIMNNPADIKKELDLSAANRADVAEAWQKLQSQIVTENGRARCPKSMRRAARTAALMTSSWVW